MDQVSRVRVDRLPLFYWRLLTLSLVIVVVWAEPIFCDSWFARWGGHVWFDVALLLEALVATSMLALSGGAGFV